MGIVGGMITYEELYLKLPPERKFEFHDLVVRLGSSEKARLKPFKVAWQEALDDAALIVEGWISEDAAREISGLPDDLLESLL